MIHGQIDRREFLTRFLGNSVLAAGGSLVGAAAAYELYRQRQLANAGALQRGDYSLPLATAKAANAATPTSAVGVHRAQAPFRTPDGVQAAAASPTESPAQPPTDDSATQAAGEPACPAGADLPAELAPVRLTIQSIGLQNAKVTTVGARIDKGELVWATADHAVGYLAGSGVPGRPGNVVLAGHISSPLRGEGDIFHALPSLADRLGSRVALQTADGSRFFYDIKATKTVEPKDIDVLDQCVTAPVLTLLTCWPDADYSHRFVALGQFVGRS